MLPIHETEVTPDVDLNRSYPSLPRFCSIYEVDVGSSAAVKGCFCHLFFSAPVVEDDRGMVHFASIRHALR